MTIGEIMKDLQDQLQQEKDFNNELKDLLTKSKHNTDRAINVGQKAADLLETKQEDIEYLVKERFHRSVFHGCVYFMILVGIVISLFS